MFFVLRRAQGGITQMAREGWQAQREFNVKNAV
jgi:hypothetical protein